MAVLLALRGLPACAHPDQLVGIKQWIASHEAFHELLADTAMATRDAGDGLVRRGEPVGNAFDAAVPIHVFVPVGPCVHFLTMQTALLRIMHIAYRNASPSPTLCNRSHQSLFMSRFTDNLTARMKHLGMEVQDVHAELTRRGFPVEYSTVAGWLNGHRGGRWKVDELQGLLEVLQTNLAEMAGHAELVEAPVPAITAREMQKLSMEQQQAILAMVKSMTSSIS